MNKPKISVLIPCYNQGGFIDQALDSVLNQTGDSFIVEVIIVNDGSTDSFTNEHLQKIQHPQVKVFRTENQGLASTRNFAYSKATGDYIQFLDADDMLAKEKFHLQLQIFHDNPEVDICYSSYQLFEDNLANLNGQYAQLSIGNRPLHDFLYRWESEISIPIHCGLFRKSCWQTNELPFENGFRSKEDWIMWTQLALKQKKFFFLNEDLAFYRRHSQNMTNNFVKMNMQFILAMQFIKTKLPIEEAQKFENHCFSYTMSNISWFYQNEFETKNHLQQKYDEFARLVQQATQEVQFANNERLKVIQENQAYAADFQKLNSNIFIKIFIRLFYRNKLLSIKNNLSEQTAEQKLEAQLDSLGLDRISNLLANIFRKKIPQFDPKVTLKALFSLDDVLYKLEGLESIRYGNGVHTKHRHTKYHDFFIDNIFTSEVILDVGCGNGALAFDIATRSLASKVIGIDISKPNIDLAKSRFYHPKVEYINGDALERLPNEKFDVIVLSNVLEHIEKRVEFLTKLTSEFNPKRFLIRVPMFERDWRVPLKKEIGAEWRLDDTHYTEYTESEIKNEIRQAGLQLESFKGIWGEFWLVAK